MNLADLQPQLLTYEERDGCVFHVFVDDFAQAQGVIFLCPKCFEANSGPVGTHSVITWFQDRSVPEQAKPGPARWAVSGTSLADLTLSPSVLLLGACGWHGWVRAGQVTSC